MFIGAYVETPDSKAADGFREHGLTFPDSQAAVRAVVRYRPACRAVFVCRDPRRSPALTDLHEIRKAADLRLP